MPGLEHPQPGTAIATGRLRACLLYTSSQAGSITEVLHSGATRVHVVTLLEEMPVQETVDAVAELRALGMPVGAVIINQTRSREDVDPALGAVDGHAVDLSLIHI